MKKENNNVKGSLVDIRLDRDGSRTVMIDLPESGVEELKLLLEVWDTAIDQHANGRPKLFYAFMLIASMCCLCFKGGDEAFMAQIKELKGLASKLIGPLKEKEQKYS